MYIYIYIYIYIHIYLYVWQPTKHPDTDIEIDTHIIRTFIHTSVISECIIYIRKRVCACVCGRAHVGV